MDFLLIENIPPLRVREARFWRVENIVFWVLVWNQLSDSNLPYSPPYQSSKLHLQAVLFSFGRHTKQSHGFLSSPKRQFVILNSPAPINDFMKHESIEQCKSVCVYVRPDGLECFVRSFRCWNSGWARLRFFAILEISTINFPHFCLVLCDFYGEGGSRKLWFILWTNTRGITEFRTNSTLQEAAMFFYSSAFSKIWLQYNHGITSSPTVRTPALHRVEKLVAFLFLVGRPWEVRIFGHQISAQATGNFTKGKYVQEHKGFVPEFCPKGPEWGPFINSATRVFFICWLLCTDSEKIK